MCFSEIIQENVSIYPLFYCPNISKNLQNSMKNIMFEILTVDILITFRLFLSGVMPDWSMEDQLVSVFGKRGYPLRRYWRMMYWMPRFKNASSWLLPQDLPNDTLELAKLAVSRMTSVDPTTDISVYQVIYRVYFTYSLDYVYSIS